MTSPSTINKTMKFCLHFVGVWPGTPLPGLHKIFWIVAMTLSQTYQYDYIISHYKTESLVTLIDSLSITMAFTLSCIKLIVSWTNHGVLREILTTMEKDCQKYADIDTNNLIAKTSMLSFRLTTAITVGHLVSVVLYTLGTIGYQEGSNSTRELLFKMDLPFDTNESPAYELVITAQFLHLVTSSLNFGTFSAFLLMVTFHIGCHVDILCNTMWDPSLVDKEQILFFISRQQEITMLGKKIEQLFTYIALGQLLSNTLITCCVGYLIVIISSVGFLNDISSKITSKVQVLFFSFCHSRMCNVHNTHNNVICKVTRPK
ncbi:uncharacterized protein LOC117226777 isoform X2 [Megalopta genalis]|uniref:uncharacterized protein LOC117226777 isoform X2 n=1 Tax=Megalopta genalis TaxID=115081 RepID=UPI003FD098CE